MRKLTSLIIFLLCATQLLVYAGGRKDNKSYEVDDPGGFSEPIDIEGKKAGKWNFYIEAQDKSGNATVVGPYNIYIDPESDLPAAHIINPQMNTRVQGNLNIAGTCIDDDGIAYVELAIRRGNDGRGEIMLETRAQGTEFWSCFVDTSDTQKWRDGVYTITAWGVDINGLSGISDAFQTKKHKKHEVVWNLDRKKPEIAVTSHAPGALVNGRVHIKGTVRDGNGIETLSYSADNEIRFQNASLRYDRKNDLYSFDIPIDTRAFEDGLAVIQFRAKDKMKSEGALSFLILANNTGSVAQMDLPIAQINLPLEGETISSDFVVSGVCYDNDKIRQIYWRIDNGPENVIEAANVFSIPVSLSSLTDNEHTVTVRAEDIYGIKGEAVTRKFRVSLKEPVAVMTYSAASETTGGEIRISGSASDGNGIALVQVSFDNGNTYNDAEGTNNWSYSFNPKIIKDGNHAVFVRVTDNHGSSAMYSFLVSIDSKLVKSGQQNFVDVLYPLNRQHLHGNFNIYGYAGGLDKAQSVSLLVNGKEAMTEEVNAAGYYRFQMKSENLASAGNVFVVRGNFGSGGTAESQPRTVQYTAYGPWITIDTMNMGDFVYERPWLFGRAGYELSEEDIAILHDKKADKEAKSAVEAKKLSKVELSFNNGKTFFEANKSREKNSDWRYRLETGDMTEGIHYILARSTMANGDTAITRFLVQIDKTAPAIRLITPVPGEHYNGELEFAASVSDDVELKSVSFNLRQGSKAFYGVPGFIKGLYFDFTIPPFIKQAWNGAPAIFEGGATYMDFGFGLSFFNDIVKVQLQYGTMTQSLYESMGETGFLRYGGHVLGIKLLANVYQFSFGSFLGPSWEWLSASFALGANFSLFDLADQGYTQSGNPTWLSAILVQIEFPKVTFPNRKYLRTFSLFTEGQLWFVPTDMNAASHGIETVIPHIILGLRAYIF